jgi:hypothetical protein
VGHEQRLHDARELAHADEVLHDLGQALLVLVHEEGRPVRELLVDARERRAVVLGQRDALEYDARAS